MPKKNAPLTATQVKNVQADGKELSLPDGSGLVLLVKPSGVKTWQLRYYRPATSGRKTRPGQPVRMLSIPLTKAVNFHGNGYGKHHADALKDGWQSNHGTAGREWIKRLADNHGKVVEIVRECEKRWRSIIPADYGEQVHRVASRFAILKAALLTGQEYRMGRANIPRCDTA